MTGPGNVGGVPSKPPSGDETTQGVGGGALPDINWAKASLDDLRIAFILSEGPDKGQKMFNQFQMMIAQTCISQMKAVEPKKQDDQQNQ